LKSKFTLKGKKLSTKFMKVSRKCKWKCYQKINEDQKRIIFKNYYTLILDNQNQFIADSIEEYPKRTHRIKQIMLNIVNFNFQNNIYLKYTIKNRGVLSNVYEYVGHKSQKN